MLTLGGRVAVFTLVGLTILPPCASAQDEGESIVEQMAATYAALTSYQDVGVVKHRFGKTPFKTYFERPTRFRFEWISSHPFILLRFVKDSHVVWSDGEHAFTYWSTPVFGKYEREKTLSLAIAGATGVSKGSAHTISALLMDEDKVSGFRVSRLRNIRLIKEETFEGTPCYVVRGDHPGGFGPYELWIGKDDHLLRAVFKDGDAEIHREIRVNVDIPDTIFSFQPPTKKKPTESK